MKAIRFFSLRVRLVVLVLLAVIPALVLILYTARVQRLVAREAFHEDLSRIASLTASDVQGVMEGAHQLLRGLAQFQEIRGGDAATCGAVMTRLMAMYPVYSALAVASPDGTVICSGVPLTKAVSVADRSWLQQALRSGDFVVGDAQVDDLTGTRSLNLAYPIQETGRVESVVFAAVNLRYLNGRASHIKLPEGASLVVADRNGAVLAASAGAPSEASPPKLTPALRGRGTTEMTDADGVRRIYAFCPVVGKSGAADAYVSVNIPASAALAEADEHLAHNLLGLAVVSLLALAAAWFVGHTIVLGKANDELELRVQERTKELAHEQMLLRMLMDNMPDTIYFKDTHSRFTRVNRAQAEVLGVKSPDQAIGKTDADFFTPEHAQAALADERRILETGESVINKKERIRRADGQYRWVTATKVPLRDEHGKIIGLVGISRDVPPNA
jgi:PAS domain S-box-containing protein